MTDNVTSGQRTLADERVLLERLREGDRESLAALYRAHRRPVYVTSLSILRTRFEAEDVLQDTFVTMWIRRRSITLVGQSTLPWLLTTAKYLSLNRARAARRSRSDSVEVAAELPSLARGPAGAALLVELQTELQSAIAQLSDTDQAIVELCMVNDLSYQQAARQLGLTHAALRNRLSRLRAQLRATLTFRHEGNDDVQQ